MKEMEITVQVLDTYENLNKQLLNLGFIMVEYFVLDDHYYISDQKENIKHLTYKQLISNSILIRRVIQESESVSLVYKNKQIDEKGNVVSEEKIKTSIGSLKNACSIFECAGLYNWCNIETKSYTYNKGNITFLVQVVDGLGVFIEYEEDETMAHLNEEQKVEYMKNVLTSLGLNLGNDYSCKKVYMKYLKENV